MYVLILMDFTANDCRPVEHNWRLNNIQNGRNSLIHFSIDDDLDF